MIIALYIIGPIFTILSLASKLKEVRYETDAAVERIVAALGFPR